MLIHLLQKRTFECGGLLGEDLGVVPDVAQKLARGEGLAPVFVFDRRSDSPVTTCVELQLVQAVERGMEDTTILFNISFNIRNGDQATRDGGLN